MCSKVVKNNSKVLRNNKGELIIIKKIEPYLKVIKSVPTFASILDGLDDKIIENMDNEIEEVINNYGGYVDSLSDFSLFITKKV